MLGFYGLVGGDAVGALLRHAQVPSPRIQLEAAQATLILGQP